MKKPIKGSSEDEDAFRIRLVEWDSNNHQILTWLRNTSIPSISNLLGNFDDAHTAWDMLAKRYSSSHGTREYQLPHMMLVSQFMSAPRSTHYAAVLRILRYLKGTLFHGDPTDRRSTTGYCFLLGSSLISWRTKKQSVVARSSIEAEYRALTDTTSELLWLQWLLQDLGVSTSSATPIYCDNRSAIQIAHNDVFHERTKHIEIDCHLVRHHLLQGSLQLISVSSHDQLADIFTKSTSH
uniref:Reverse transcriptase Ty1/copia-type domain-containing protein n=1 Tax=Fagus sylvatica TaxID=28930 RepID=A0A2N9H6G6_FAGSY